MPVENRLDMELTGIKTPVGLKIQGPDLDGIQQIGSQIEEILGAVPGTRRSFRRTRLSGILHQYRCEPRRRRALWPDGRRRAAGDHFGNRRREHRDNVEGANAIPINVRYRADYRHDLDELRRCADMTPNGAQMPLGEVAACRFARDPR